MDDKSIKQVMRIIGGKRTRTPRHIYERAPKVFGAHQLSRHFFTFRVTGSLVGWFEVWCNNEGVIACKNAIAHETVSLGFRVVFLPTRFSIRSVGHRRPCLVTPIEASADLQLIMDQLEAASYVGPQTMAV